MNPRLIVGLAIIALLGAVFYLGLQGDPRTPPPRRLGQPVLSFTAPVLDPYQSDYGSNLNLADYLGTKPLVVNFWASWCYPQCYQEAPELEAAWQQYQDRVLFIGVNTQDKSVEALKFIAQFQLSFPQVADPRGSIALDYATTGVPETFVIDQNGLLQAHFIGGVSQDKLEEALESLLGES